MKRYIIRSANNPEFVLLGQDGPNENWGKMPVGNIGRDLDLFDNYQEAREFMAKYWPGTFYVIDDVNYHSECDQIHPEPDSECPFI